LGGKMGIDATNKIAAETDREWGRLASMDKATKEQVKLIARDLGL
jgi:4-hydroxy-3-polyprenylbenzoate decarboxylase